MENSYKPVFSPEDYINIHTYTAMGMSYEDFELPVVGICNTWSELVPGQYNLRQVADFVKKGILRAGGNPVEFGTIACCDGVTTGNDGDYYVLPSRETIADSVEIMAKAHKLDTMVLIGSCDKIVPGLLMGAAWLDIPTIFIPGGPSLSGPPFGKKLKGDCTCITEAMGMEQAGVITHEELKKLARLTDPTCGSCQFMGTANTMCCFAEALGMSLPGAALIPAVYAERFRCAFQTGEQIVRLVQRGVRPKDIMTYEAIENTIKVMMAIGGSTNSVIHMCAIAHELGFNPDMVLRSFDRISAEIPHIASVNPASYLYDCEDFYKAGGIPTVMKKLGPHLERSVMTVTGKTLGENIDSYVSFYPENTDLIRDLEHPHTKIGGIAIMRGNLAPDSGVSKPAAIDERVRRFTGRAVCFDSQEACVRALEQRKIQKGDVIVIRYEGPRGGPGMREMYAPLKMLNGQGLALDTALVTDGRVSGTNNGCYVVHVSPEAAVGGPIALVQDGDRITIDVIERRLELHVSEEELAQRRAAWQYTPKKTSGYLARYAALATSGSRGCVLEWEYPHRKS